MAPNYQVPAKVCRNVFLYLQKERNLTAIPFILILEYGQLNATQGKTIQHIKFLSERIHTTPLKSSDNSPPVTFMCDPFPP